MYIYTYTHLDTCDNCVNLFVIVGDIEFTGLFCYPLPLYTLKTVVIENLPIEPLSTSGVTWNQYYSIESRLRELAGNLWGPPHLTYIHICMQAYPEKNSLTFSNFGHLQERLLWRSVYRKTWIIFSHHFLNNFYLFMYLISDFCTYLLFLFINLIYLHQKISCKQ